MKASAKQMFVVVAMLFVANMSRALAHWPDQSPHQFADLGEFTFEGGGSIPNLRMSYVTHGKLNAARDNAILFMHGFGLNHHQADHLIGPGQPLDTDKYFIICTDQLGSTQTTFEHSTSPTNSGLKMKFPNYSGVDRVRAEHKLLTEGLGIARLLAVTGISSGATHSVQFAVSFPTFVEGIFPIVGGSRDTTQGFFYGALMVSNIVNCNGWNEGNYEENPAICATNGLSPLIPYFYTRDWWLHHIDTPEAYTKWRNTWGAYYLDIQDARDLYYLIMSGEKGIGDTPGFNGDTAAALASIKAKTLYIVTPQDQFNPPPYIEHDLKSIPNAKAVWINSDAGHLMCCNGDPNATHELGEAIKEFLQELTASRSASK